MKHRGDQQEVDPPHHDHHLRRFLADPPEQGREQAELGVVGEADAEGVAVGRGVEFTGPADRAGNDVHRRLQFPEYLQGALGRLEGAAVAHQQRIAEQVAQSRQRMTDRWLAQVQTLGRPGDVLFGEQGVEDHQQVEVDASKIIHLLHALDNKTEFKSARRIP
ncbi:hypothetical protein D9M73_208930 [compost metagenome]